MTTPSTCSRPTCGTCFRSGSPVRTSPRSATAGPAPTPATPDSRRFSGSGTHSAIRWQLPASPALAPGATRTLTYAMTIPADTSVNTSFPNTAAVRSYDTATNRPGVTAEHLPREQHRHLDRRARLGRPCRSGRLRGAHPERRARQEQPHRHHRAEQRPQPGRRRRDPDLHPAAAGPGPHLGLPRRALRPDADRHHLPVLERRRSPRATRRRRRTRCRPASPSTRRTARCVSRPATPTTTTPRTCSRSGSEPGSAPWPPTRRASSASTPRRFNSQSALGLGTDLPDGDRPLDRHRRGAPDHADQDRRRPGQLRRGRSDRSPTPCAWSARPAARRPTTSGSSTVCRTA